MFYLIAAMLQTSIFWILLIIVSILVFSAGIYFLFSNKNLFEKRNSALLNASQSISELDRCDIANLESVQNSLNMSEFDLLSTAADRIVDDSARIYQGKWISDPHKLFTLDNLLTRSEFTALSVEIPIQIFTLSLLASALFWLAGFSLFDGDRTAILNLAALPVCIGLLLSLLLFFANQRQRSELTRSMNYLAETISRRLPIFEELAGTAVLIDSFVQYDREMAESVSNLSEIVQGLARNDLADRIANNVKHVMENDIAPSIKESAKNLSSLTEQLQERQEKGMSELAGIFTQQLGAKLNHELTPLFLETDHLVEELHNTSASFDVAMEALKQAREDSYSVQEQTAGVLSSLLESRRNFENDMKLSNEAINRLSDECQKMTSLYSGQVDNLSDNLKTLSSNISTLNSESSKNVEILSNDLKGLSSELSTEFGKRNEELLENLNQQHSLLLEGLNAQSDSLSTSLKLHTDSFSDKLALIMAQFEEKLNAGTMGVDEELRKHVNNLQAGNKQLVHLLEQLGEGSAAMVGDIRRLSLEMNRSAERLGQESNEIDESIKELNAKLENSISIFSEQMIKSVTEAMDSFEKAVSEIALRLSSSSSELSDSANRIANSLSQSQLKERL